MDMAGASAAQVAWIEMRAELAALVNQMTPEDAGAVLRHTIEECDNGALVIAHMLGHARTVVTQHVERRHQQGDLYRWFIINGVLLANGKTIWVAHGVPILADELPGGDAACVEVAERVRARYEMTYHDPAACWVWLTLDEQGSSTHYEIGTRPFGRHSDSVL